MSVEQNGGSPLSYYLAEKNGLCIVAFAGELTQTAAEVLESCRAEITARTCSWVILCFKEVKTIERSQVAAIARLQKAVRSKPAHLLLCSLSAELRRFLDESGVLRLNEVREDLREAVQSIETGSS